MGFATGALGTLLPKLGQLLQGEYNLHKSAKKDIEFLKRELESTHAALLRVSEVPLEQLDEQIRIWAREAREVSYDMEDIIDTFLVSLDVGRLHTNLVKRVGEKAINLCGVKKNARTRHQIADGTSHQIAGEIKELKARIRELSEQRDRYKIEPLLSSFGNRTTGTVDPRLPALYRNERELVGVSEARGEIVRMLAQQGDDERQLKIVSIHGMGGLGKTTLAKAVYNSLQGQFDCNAFISVSRNLDMKKVLEDILLELDEAKHCTSIIAKSMDSSRQLIDVIREFLQHKRYLFVIDDVWEEQAWKIIRLALIDNKTGSRIITTSRNRAIAATPGGVTYRLKSLSRCDSEKLFYKRIFGGEGNRPADNQLSEVADKILKNCDGLPLAIITIASVLASKPWEKWSEVYNSIALRHESNRYMDNMRNILSFSYYDLPFHLRTCLLHLSVFPEHCCIEKDFLIWMWIAEGFVWGRQGMSLFEEGECYFNELANRSLIQIVEDNFRDRVYPCRVHPTMFSLIRSFARQVHFFTALDDEHNTSAGSNKVRRLALHQRNAENNMMETVRSFNASLCFLDGMPQFSSFQVLRVLALEYCPGMDIEHLKQIGNLVHLRYLGLVGTNVIELPEEAIGGLRFLQTLDLRETGIEQLPRATIKLTRLMCLCTDRIRTVPEGMGGLTSLEYLRLHHVSGDSVLLATELSKLERLRVLEIGFEEFDERLERTLVESLRHLTRIRILEVHCQASTRAFVREDLWVLPRHLYQLVVGGIWFSRLPAWINPFRLPGLRHIHVGVEQVEDRDMGTIGAFPSLRSLILVTVRDEQHHTINTVGGGNNAFKNLKFFTTNIPIKFECTLGPPMPSLEDLKVHVDIRAAKDAESLLGSLANLPSLQKVTVVLECRGASAADVEEADAAVRRAISVLLQNRPTVEVIVKNEPDEVPLAEQLRPRNPRFEELRREMEKMQANVQLEEDSREISLAETASQ